MTQEPSYRTGVIVARIVWRWGGLVIGGALGAGARQLILSSGGPEIPGMILESIGHALAVAAAGIVLIWAVHLVWSTFPSQRLRAKADLIDTAMKALEKDHPRSELVVDVAGFETKTASATKSLLHQVIHALDRLKVPHPPFDHSVGPWLVFLSRLSAYARVGDLHQAKSIWTEMEKIRNSMVEAEEEKHLDAERERILKIAQTLKLYFRLEDKPLHDAGERAEIEERIDSLCMDLLKAGFGVEGPGLPMYDPDVRRLWICHVNRLLPYLEKDLDLARQKLKEWQQPGDKGQTQ